MSHRSKSTQGEPTSPWLCDANAPAWPSYQGSFTPVGTSPSGRVTVYVDPSLGKQAQQNAQDLLKDADRVVNANDGLFGTTGGPVSVIVFALGGATDGTGGADHNGCDYTTGNAIEVDVSYGNSARVSALFEAELSECSMNGNLCGESTGEALSRWCAAVIGNNALADFRHRPSMGLRWHAGLRQPDREHRSECRQHRLRHGFLSWMISQGHGLEKIAPAMVNLGDSGTLARLYATLTGDSAGNAWPNFQDAVQNLPSGIKNDDPFGGLSKPLQLANIPATACLPLQGRMHP